MRSYEVDDETAMKLPPRYSPSTLERQFHTEFNQLESMEESMRQLTNMERTRAVSMAQQETVSLAQMLKVRKVLAHTDAWRMYKNLTHIDALCVRDMTEMV